MGTAFPFTNINNFRAYTYQTVRNSIIDRRGTDESQRSKGVSSGSPLVHSGGAPLVGAGVPLDGPLIGQQLCNTSLLNGNRSLHNNENETKFLN